MKKWKTFYRSALAAGLYFFFSCFSPEQKKVDELVFPFHNKIYCYQVTGNTLSVKKTTRYLFSKYYDAAGPIHWFCGSIAGTTQQNVLLKYNTENNSIKEILKGQYLKIIPLDGHLITVSDEYIRGKGFFYEFYKLDKKALKYRKLYSIYIDLMISDVEIKSSTIFLAGYDKLDENNLIIQVKPGNKTMQLLVTEPQNRNFFKLIQTENELIFYISGQDWQESIEIEFRRFSFLQLKKADNIVPVKCKVPFPVNSYILYGKGFFEKGYIYLPVLDKEHNTGLLKSESPENFLPFSYYPLSTGIYASLPSDPAFDTDFLYFLGYNYYKEKSKLYLLRMPRVISIQNSNDIQYIPLDTGKNPGSS
ncbi:MAG: hypothetical protein JXB88_10470 [Spirochaetales bacterium]|nr:hypothetical protein [Spirochaetales bacterium]